METKGQVSSQGRSHEEMVLSWPLKTQNDLVYGEGGRWGTERRANMGDILGIRKGPT
jgi:hypothetical protein